MSSSKDYKEALEALGFSLKQESDYYPGFADEQEFDPGYVVTTSILKFRCPAADKHFDIRFNAEKGFQSHLINELIEKLSPIAYYLDPIIQIRLERQAQEISELKEKIKKLEKAERLQSVLESHGFKSTL